MSGIPDILSILDFLNRLDLAPFYHVSLCVLVLASLVFIRFPVMRHPRRRWRVLLFFIFLWVLGYSTVIYDWHSLVIISSMIFLAVYSLLAWRSLDKPIGFSRYILRKLEQKMMLCIYEHVDDASLASRPLLLCTVADVFAWIMLRYHYLAQMGRYSEAYMLLDQLPIAILFSGEKDTIQLKKAYCLYHLGDVNKARIFMNSIDNRDVSWFQLDSMLYEAQGNFSKAFDKLETAKNKLVNNYHLCASIYCNFGRLWKMQGNNAEAAYYYGLAASHAVKDNDRLSIHVAYQNLILTSALSEGASEHTNRLLDEYRKQIDLAYRIDKLEFNNLLIQYARQTSSSLDYAILVKNTYCQLKMNAPASQRFALQISTARMVRNGRMNPQFILEDIRTDFKEYITRPMPERYYLYKETNIFLDSLRRTPQLDIEKVIKNVKYYIRNQAIKDIEEYQLLLKPWQVHERAELLKELAGLLKENIKPYSFSRAQGILKDVYNLYKNSGQYIEGIDALLNIADECTYCKNRDRNHMTCYPDDMRSAMKKAEDEMALISSYPIMALFHLRLGYYELFLQNGERALFHLHIFEAHNINILHYDEWLQGFYIWLKRYKSGEITSIQEMLA